jgi:hypothetical protein
MHDSIASARPDKSPANGEAPKPEPEPLTLEPDPELTREIHPREGGDVGIEAEDIDDFDEEADGGEETPGKIKLRKPRPREWNIIDPRRVIPVRLLVHKPDGEDSIKEEFYYVAKPLRRAIEDSLKAVRVYLYFSVSAEEFRLWPVKVTVDNSYYESLQAKLFNQKTDVLLAHEWRVWAVQRKSFYRVKLRTPSADRPPVLWPDKPLVKLLEEAIGADHLITGTDHPMYVALIDGEEV